MAQEQGQEDPRCLRDAPGAAPGRLSGIGAFRGWHCPRGSGSPLRAQPEQAGSLGRASPLLSSQRSGSAGNPRLAAPVTFAERGLIAREQSRSGAAPGSCDSSEGLLGLGSALPRVPHSVFPCHCPQHQPCCPAAPGYQPQLVSRGD